MAQPLPEFDRMWLWRPSALGDVQRSVTRAKTLGFTDLVFMVNQPGQDRFEWFGGLDSFKKGCELAHKGGLAPSLATWIDPRPAFVESAATALNDTVGELDCRFLAFDAEWPWWKPFGSSQAKGKATTAVQEVVKPAFADVTRPIVVTSLPLLPPAMVPLVQWAVAEHDGAGAGQAYSHWEGKDWQETQLAQPPNFPGATWKAWKGAAGDRQALILATFGELLPFRVIDGKRINTPWTAEDALRASVQATAAAGGRELSFWVEKPLFADNEDGAGWRRVVSSIPITGADSLWPSRLPLVGVLVGGAAVVTTAYVTRHKWLPTVRGWLGMGGKG